MNIEDKSRLRKLKKEEGESHISGGEYAQRLQDYYEKQTNAEGGDLFGWAKKPIAPVSSVEEDEDPIAALLRSNARVFERNSSSKLLKPGARLEYTKL